MLALAQCLTNFREQDICCRSGGGIFGFNDDCRCKRGVKPQSGSEKPCRETQRLIQMGQITISVGIAFWPRDAEDVCLMYCKLADNKLYEAKHDGRNCTKSTAVRGFGTILL